MLCLRIAVVACFALLQGVLYAQTAQITGRIVDASRAVVPGVELEITNLKTGIVRKAETNSEGVYAVPGLQPGAYRIAARADGFRPVESGEIQLSIEQVARFDFTMEVGQVSSSVEVTAAAVALQSESTTVGQVIDNTRIVELPLNGRNYLELAQLTAGVVPSRGFQTAAGNVTALGARALQTNVLLDGVDNTVSLTGGYLSSEIQHVTPSIDSVQEFRVVSNNNSAEYGFRLGATIIVSTKSGTNQFRGSLYEFLRNDKIGVGPPTETTG